MSTRNISWRVKAAGSCGWQPYHLHMSIVLKSDNLSFLEPSGPLQACTVIAFPVSLQIFSISMESFNKNETWINEQSSWVISVITDPVSTWIPTHHSDLSYCRNRFWVLDVLNPRASLLSVSHALDWRYVITDVPIHLEVRTEWRSVCCLSAALSHAIQYAFYASAHSPF